MPLSKEERIEIILLAGRGSCRQVAKEFNATHADQIQVTHDTVAKLIDKFKKTGSVEDKPRSGRPRTSTDEDTSTNVLAAFSKSPNKSIRRLSAETGISQASVARILKENKWHPYKLHMLQHLSEDDPDRRMEFCEWAIDQMDRDPTFSAGILFTDEANFYMNGEVNRQNLRYWSDVNPHWTSPSRMQGAQKLMVWCGIWDTRILGPVFIEGNLTGEKYLNLLKEEVMPSLLTEDGKFPSFFQQDGAPPHFCVRVRQWLDQQFSGQWIGRRGPIEWPPRSPDLTPLDFYLWGHLKALVYAVRLRDLEHLEDRIRAACAQITPNILTQVRRDWEERVRACHLMEGAHIEHLL